MSVRLCEQGCVWVRLRVSVDLGRRGLEDPPVRIRRHSRPRAQPTAAPRTPPPGPSVKKVPSLRSLSGSFIDVDSDDPFDEDENTLNAMIEGCAVPPRPRGGVGRASPALPSPPSPSHSRCTVTALRLPPPHCLRTPPPPTPGSALHTPRTPAILRGPPRTLPKPSWSHPNPRPSPMPPPRSGLCLVGAGAGGDPLPW